MAKINIEYDTVSKDLSVIVDGKDIPAERVCVESYGSGEEKYGYIDIYAKPDKENGVTYRMSAHGSELKKSNAIEDWARQALKKN